MQIVDEILDDVKLSIIEKIQERLDPSLTIDECVEETDVILDFILEQI